MKFVFDSNVRSLPESFDYGAGTVGTRPGNVDIGTYEQRIEFARRMHQRPKNSMEYERVLRTILTGPDVAMVYAAALQWPNHPDVLAEWDRLDDNGSKDEVLDGLPGKVRWSRDVYNIAQDTREDVDDRLKAFRLYAEAHGYVGQRGGTNVNIDNRSIILVPQRAAKVDDPEREQKIVEAQARLISDARGK